MNIKYLTLLSKNKKWIALLICSILFAMIAEDVLEQERMFIDSTIYGALTNIISAKYTSFFTFITQLAGTPVLVALCVLLFIFIRNNRYGFIITLNLLNTTLLNQALKSIFTRPRPSILILADVSGYSFPSGHAMASMSFYGFIIYLLWQTQIRKKVKLILSMLLAVIIGLIGVSRIYLGVHYASDVIAGFLFSTGYLILFTHFVSNYLKGSEPMSKPATNKKNNKKLINSFKYAINGIKECFKSERNFAIHFSIMILVILLGILLKIAFYEWIICILLFGLVLFAEMINTAIEEVTDLLMPQMHSKAKRAKDIAAGGVLILSVTSAIIGLIIFIPKIYHLFF